MRSLEMALRRKRGGPGLALRKYLAVLQVSMANNLAYLLEVFFRSLLLIVLVFILSQLWETTFATRGVHLLDGFSVNDMIWYLVATETIATSQPAITRTIDQEVRSGQLAYLLGRPCNYVLYHFASYLGERLTRIAISGPVAIVLALLFVGLPHLSLWGMLVWPLLALLAMTLEFVIQFSIGLLAFWIEETTSFALIFNRLTLLFGGVLLPLSIFPEPLRSITEALPFSAIAYGPARTLVHFEPAFFWTLLVRQLITVLVLGLLLALLYRAALRRTSINGG